MLVALGVVLIAVEVFVVPGVGLAGVLGVVSLGAGAFMAMISRDFDLVSSDDLFRAGLTVALTLCGAVLGVVTAIALLARRGAPRGLVLSAGSATGEPVRGRASIGWLDWFGADDRLEPDRVERPADDDRFGRTTGAVVDDGVDDRFRQHDVESLLGRVGVAVSDLRPGGIAEIDGRRVDVVTSGEFLPAGEPIEVICDERYRRVVHRRS